MQQNLQIGSSRLWKTRWYT